MKIYLAIPYTRIEELSFKTANQIAGKLMNEGHIVFSPISHTHPIAIQCELPGGWDYWSKFDECFLEWCDEVCVIKLNGWKLSKGVNAEMSIAKNLGKPVRYINP